MTIDINTLNVGDVCPCGVGLVAMVDARDDKFRCWKAMTAFMPAVTTDHDHFIGMKSSGFYTNLTNVVVTPARASSVLAALNSKSYRFVETPTPTVATSPRHPHTCPACRGAVYIGFTTIEHAATGNARCP